MRKQRQGPSNRYQFIITIILLFTAAIANYGYSRPEPELRRSPLREFPTAFGDWRVINEQEIDEESMALLLVDDYIMRTYVNSKGVAIGLYIGYFDTQRERKQVHSPRQCLPGAGWEVLQHREHVLNPRGQKESENRINLYLMAKGTERQVYLWWYHGRGRIFSSEYMNKLYLIWDIITKGRSDGAIVRINMPAISTIDQTLNLQLSFIDHFFSVLPQFIPD